MAKDPEADMTKPIVHAKGKKFWPVLEMLRYHWLPGEHASLSGWL